MKLLVAFNQATSLKWIIDISGRQAAPQKYRRYKGSLDFFVERRSVLPEVDSGTNLV
jgi:hypothetical protein